MGVTHLEMEINEWKLGNKNWEMEIRITLVWGVTPGSLLAASGPLTLFLFLPTLVCPCIQPFYLVQLFHLIQSFHLIQLFHHVQLFHLIQFYKSSWQSQNNPLFETIEQSLNFHIQPILFSCKTWSALEAHTSSSPCSLLCPGTKLISIAKL